MSLPCCRDFGFDPLGLGKDPEKLAKFTENELINARYAMLAVPGCLIVELIGQGNWWDAPQWVRQLHMIGITNFYIAIFV